MATSETKIADGEAVVGQEPDRNRWVAKVGDRVVGALTYQFAGNRYVLISVHVDTDLRHRGVATRLAISALDDIRATGRKITVICPFVGDVLKRHPDYFDLVDPVHPGSGISGTPRAAVSRDAHEAGTVEPTRSSASEGDAAPDDDVTRIMVLGAIAFRGPLTRTGVSEVHREWEVSRWTAVTQESIAHAVCLLADSGYIHESTSGSAERLLHCTAQGRDELHRLLRRLLAADTFQPFNLLPLLHFARVLSPAELADGLRRRILYIDEVLAYETSAISRAAANGPDHASEIVRLNWHRYNADRSWSLEFIGRLYGGTAADSSTR